MIVTGDNGTLTLWDWNSGTPFQTLDDIPQPGSLEAEAGVFCSTFDQTGTRLITGCADKTIKVCVIPFPCLLMILLTMLIARNRFMLNSLPESRSCFRVRERFALAPVTLLLYF